MCALYADMVRNKYLEITKVNYIYIYIPVNDNALSPCSCLAPPVVSKSFHCKLNPVVLF